RWTGPAGRGLAVGAWVLTDLVGRGTAMELALTGRWVEAGEALAMGLVNRVEDDPGQAAAGLAAELAAQGPGMAAKVKSVTAAGGLLDRLHAERQANRSAWAQAIAPAGGGAPARSGAGPGGGGTCPAPGICPPTAAGWAGAPSPSWPPRPPPGGPAGARAPWAARRSPT